MKVKTGIMIASLAAATLLPLSSKGQEKKENITKKNQTEILNNLKDKEGCEILSKTHEEIINIPADSLPLETIREHMLIEINKIRDSLGIESHLKLNNKISDCTQEYAKYMYTNNWFEHEDKEKKKPLR